MRLILDNGELDLPSDLTFEIRKTSSLFSEYGEQSLPVTLPASSHNLNVLGQPLRPERALRHVNELPAMLTSGRFCKKGQLIISSFSSSGITASFCFSESAIYAEYKDTNVKELFKDSIRKDYNTPWEWAEYLCRIYRGECSDDFTVFPVLVNKNEDKYLVLNEPDIASAMSQSPSLISAARTIEVSGSSENVPEGYGITPFLYLRRFVVMFFECMGHSVGENAFEDSFFDTVVLLNNNADTICSGFLNYADLVPSCTVAEMLEWFEMKFGIYMSVRPDGKTVDLAFSKSIYTNSGNMTVISTDKDAKISIEKPSHIVLKSDTSLDGAAPAAETIEELADRYGACLRLDDTKFMNWQENLPENSGIGTLVYRVSHGEFFSTVITSDGDVSLKRIGTDYFTRDGKTTDNGNEITARDMLPPLADFKMDSDGNVLTALFIGERMHSRTSVIGESAEKSEQGIMIAAEAGWTAISYGHTLRYRFGTILGLDNQGNPLNGIPDLRPTALYGLFFVEADYVSRNCTASLKVIPHLTSSEILDLGIFRQCLYGNARLLCKTFNYNVGQRLSCGECEFLILQNYINTSRDTEETILPDIKYIWIARSSENEVMAAWLEKHSLTPDVLIQWEWRWDDKPRSTESLWLASPTGTGLKAMSYPRPGRVWYIHMNQALVWQTSEQLYADSWLESVLIED